MQLLHSSYNCIPQYGTGLLGFLNWLRVSRIAMYQHSIFVKEYFLRGESHSFRSENFGPGTKHRSNLDKIDVPR